VLEPLENNTEHNRHTATQRHPEKPGKILLQQSQTRSYVRFSSQRQMHVAITNGC